jgi:hypothetical protein
MKVPNFFFLYDLFGLFYPNLQLWCVIRAGNIYFFTLRAQAKYFLGTFISRIPLFSRSPLSGQQAGQLPPAQVHQQRGGAGQSTAVSQIKGQCHARA